MGERRWVIVYERKGWFQPRAQQSIHEYRREYRIYRLLDR